MAWDKTYTHTICVAADILTASVFWNVYGFTVSSLCGLALRVSPNGSSFLCRLGRVLNWIRPGHCEAAISSDFGRAVAVIQRLGSDPALLQILSSTLGGKINVTAGVAQK